MLNPYWCSAVTSAFLAEDHLHQMNHTAQRSASNTQWNGACWTSHNRLLSVCFSGTLRSMNNMEVYFPLSMSHILMYLEMHFMSALVTQLPGYTCLFSFTMSIQKGIYFSVAMWWIGSMSFLENKNKIKESSSYIWGSTLIERHSRRELSSLWGNQIIQLR